MVYMINKKTPGFLDIPYELKGFMKNDTYSLLVKGRSGTGKTTLALSILRSLKPKNNFFYISTRSSPKQLFEHYPWLRKITKASKKDIDSQEKAQTISSFEDARLDEPESLFERVTNQLMDVKNPVIIIDTWDSVASLMDREARLNNERVLQTWRERARAKLIFTSEELVESSLESIVDGVVELDYQLMAEIRIRSLFLKKLRGIAIKRSLYYFTLKDRMLRCFSNYDPREYRIDTIQNNVREKTDYQKHVLHTGYSDLDDYVGRTLPLNGLLTIEKDSALSKDVVLLFLNDLLYNFARSHYCLLLDSELKNEFHKYKLNIKNKSMLFEIHRVDPFKKTTQSEIKQKNNYYNYLNKVASGFKEKEKLVAIMQTNLLENIITTHSDVEDYCRFIREKFELSLLILNSNNREKYYSVSDLHLKFMLMSGTLFLKCSLPSSALFGVQVSNSTPHIHLYHIL